MKKYLVHSALLIGITFDILFWGKTPGISFLIFVVLCLGSGYFLIKTEKLIPARKSFLLIIPILFLSTMIFIRKEPFTSFINFSLTLLLMAIMAMTYLSGLWVSFNLSDYVSNFLHLIGGMFALPWHPSAIQDTQQNESTVKSWVKNAKPIIRGVLLAVPILLVFTALFSSADLVFSQRIKTLIANLRLENLPEYLLRSFFILTVAYFFTGIILYAAKRSTNAHLTGEDKPILAPFLGFTETSIILGGVLLLFIAFVLIQFEYFFFGQSNITLQGFTYSEYARRGFGELVAVAVFSIMLLKGLSVISKCDTNRKKGVFTGLTIGLVALVVIILVSAFQRLFLYESAYGFSRSRTYAHVFMIWLGILLLAVVIMEIFQLQRAFANIILAILFGFSVSLNLLNVDRFIVKSNINMAAHDEVLDISYLSSLSTDAIPELVRNFSSTDLTPKVHEGLGAALICLEKNINGASVSQQKYWQSFHMSNWIAERDLQKVKQDLNKYQVKENDWTLVVISPDGIEYPCQSSKMLD
jgi:hypothetical protein